MTTKQLETKFGYVAVREAKERWEREPELRVKLIVATSGSKANITRRYNQCIRRLIEGNF